MRLLFAGILLLVMSSCSTVKKNKSQITIDEKLIGTWRLSGRTGSNGFKSYRTKVADSVVKLLIFHSNGKITGNYFNHPRYSILDNSDQGTRIGMLAIIFKGKYVVAYTYHFDNNELYLSPYPLYCDEGCSTIFKKAR